MTEVSLPAIAERLEKVRKEQGLSQEAFAKRLGVSRSAYQHYSRGKHEIPTTLLAKLLLYFKVDPYWMLAGEERSITEEREDIVLKNAISIALTTKAAFDKSPLDADANAVRNAALFAIKFLFDRAQKIENETDIIEKYIKTMEGSKQQ